MAMLDEILCSKTHEWIFEENNIATIGLTDYIIEQLGDILFVELPENDIYLSKGESFATIESVKGARELYIPISCKIIEVNEKLTNSPELLNEDCFENWLVKVECENFQQERDGLLDYSDYKDELN